MLKLEHGTTQKTDFPFLTLHHLFPACTLFFFHFLTKKNKLLHFYFFLHRYVSLLCRCWAKAMAVIALEGEYINTILRVSLGQRVLSQHGYHAGVV